ncbi:hypothetical protein, variant [Aphanomyces invadans]|uniref:RING-type domain-containing protein n=1 Tax=Aphanomyces invadans TaxID=157072 RepID=A0A024TDR3_9STRA|nr:hypothetical protein, variant [Aphanomyces invadans]ETV91452.1 hypothetical protein, variant [Aphanomyces invadans]|eukprot:XP_008879904.1 hypothetical protein, variant [Aphanomyces invadans]
MVASEAHANRQGDEACLHRMKDMATHFAQTTWSSSIFNATTPINESHRIVIILMKDLAKEWHRRQSELSERGRSVSTLYHVSWSRICVDEVQEILGKSSLAAQMMQQLNAPIRWGLSGTPVSKVADIAGVAQFLQLAPYDSSTWWLQHDIAVALELVQPILDQIVWRTSSQHVSRSLQLPSQTILPTTFVQLSAIEFAAYRPHFERYIKDIRRRIASFKGNTSLITLHELRQLLHHPAVLNLCKGASHVSLLTKCTTSIDSSAGFIAHMATRQREQCSLALSQWLGVCLSCPKQLEIAYKTWQDLATEISVPWQVQLKVLSALSALHHVSPVRYRHQIHRAILDSPCQRRLPVTLWQRIFVYLHEDFSDQQLRVLIAQQHPLLAAFQDKATAFWTAHAAPWSQHNFQSQVEASFDLERRIQLPAMVAILNDFTNMRLSEAKSRVGIFERPTLWHYLRNKTTESIDVGEIRMVTMDLLGQYMEQFSASLKLLHDVMHADWRRELQMVLRGYRDCNHATRRLDRTLVVGREERWQRRDHAHGQGRGQISLGSRCVVCTLRNRIDLALSFLVTEGKTLTLMVIFFTLEAPPEMLGLFNDCIAHLEHMVSLATLLDNWLRVSCEAQNCMAYAGDDPSAAAFKRVKVAHEKFQLANCYRQYTSTIASLDETASPATNCCDFCGTAMTRSATSLLLCCHRFCAACIAKAASNEMATHRCLVCFKSQPFALAKAPPLPPSLLACGSKMDVILQDLTAIAPHEKCVVFSQFPEVLELVMTELTKRHVRSVQLRSGNQISLRHAFETDTDVRVLLLPLKKYNHGLNLVEATHVFLIEPSLQPALHAQAIARVKRLNQTRPTFVHRYAVRDTVEEAVDAAVTHDNHRLTKGDIYRIFAHDAFLST